MMVFLKDSDIKLEKSEDSYSKQSCRPIEFNSRPSVYCEGDKTNIVYTPEMPQRLFEQLNEQLILLQVVLYEGKKLYGWLQNLLSEKNSNSQILKETPIITSVTDGQTALWKEALDSTEKRLMDLANVNTGETDLRWAWHILEDRKEEFEYLSQQLEVNSQEANVFTENLQALMVEFEVIESLHSITSEHNESNAAPKTDKVDISR